MKNKDDEYANNGMRPGYPRRITTTPHANDVVNFLSGKSYNGVVITKAEFRQIQRVYGELNPDQNILIQAGTERNFLRHAQCDGMRLMAFLAKYVEANQDPVKVLVQLVSEAGYDVAPEDYEWAYGCGMEDDD